MPASPENHSNRNVTIHTKIIADYSKINKPLIVSIAFDILKVTK